MLMQWNLLFYVLKKQLQKTGLEKNKQKLLYTQIFCQEAFNEIEADAKETLVAVEQGDTLRMMLIFTS